LTGDDFSDFVFGNSVRLWGTQDAAALLNASGRRSETQQPTGFTGCTGWRNGEFILLILFILSALGF
jgi:hypothetical protein